MAAERAGPRPATDRGPDRRHRSAKACRYRQTPAAARQSQALALARSAHPGSRVSLRDWAWQMHRCALLLSPDAPWHTPGQNWKPRSCGARPVFPALCPQRFAALFAVPIGGADRGRRPWAFSIQMGSCHGFSKGRAKLCGRHKLQEKPGFCCYLQLAAWSATSAFIADNAGARL
ncbi:hypothetical protein D3C86_1562470 [compost metagenome]